MRSLAFMSLLVVLLVFAAAIATVVFHLRKYGVPGDKTGMILNIFIGGSVVFFLATLVVFLNVPWDTLQIPTIAP